MATVVKDVLEAFLPAVEVENLPLPQHLCASYMRRDELTTLSNAHKASVICQCGSSLHLNTDGTTKNQKKLGGIVINDMVVSVNELVDGSALTAVNDVSKELKTLRETAQVLGFPNADSINWTLVASSTSDSASTQKCLNRLIEEHRAEDAQRFGVATIETVNIVENFCLMHLGLNLRKAFLMGIDCKDTNHACDDPSRKNHRVDSLSSVNCLDGMEFQNTLVVYKIFSL